MLAIQHLNRGVQLLNPNTCQPLATLNTEDQIPLCFSPDGALLAVAEILPRDKGLVRLWDLRLIRQQLVAMNLDWDATASRTSRHH